MNNNWITYESENYIFNFHKGSVAENKIKEIIQLQERVFKFICNVLKVNFNYKIKYYLCNSPTEVGELCGDNEPCNGFARRPNEIYAVVNQNIECTGYHEDAHIISYALAVPLQAFMREGLAIYFDKQWYGISNFSWANYFIKNDKYIRITKLMKNEEFFKYSCKLTYPIAGAFTEYIISLYGIEKYKKFYMKITEDFEKVCLDIFNIEFDELEKNFIQYVGDFNINEEVEKIMKNFE